MDAEKRAFLRSVKVAIICGLLLAAYLEWRIPGVVHMVVSFPLLMAAGFISLYAISYLLRRMSNNCLFCRIIAGEIPCYKVYENDNVLAFLDIGPVSKGHTLVIPKTHAENLSAQSSDDARALMDAVHLLGQKIPQALGAMGYNLGMNHGEVAGQEVMHTHLHIMPRYAGQPRSFVKTHPSPEELKEVAERIVDSL